VPGFLSSHERSQFEAEGLVYPIRVLTSGEAADYCLACERLEADLGGRPRTVEVRQMHLHFPWAFALATADRVLDAVEDLLGPDLLIWATELFAKHPCDEAVSIGWHRDGVYMGLDPQRTLTAWISLTPSCHRNGCMRAACEEDRRAASNRRAGERRRGTSQPPGEILDVELDAGEMSLHDVYLLHGSGANRSDQKRVGFAVRFTTPDARPALDHPPAVLARGEDRHGYFQLLDPPAADNGPAALEGMRASARRHLDATLANLAHASC
jgi:hypothetical protein